jgi:ribosome maturation factor RimP
LFLESGFLEARLRMAARDSGDQDERRWQPFMRNEELTELLAPVIADMGLECLGVEYSPSHGNGLVRVYIDADGRPVTVDDCEAVSRQVSATLDVNDPIPGRDTLEVSSPGLDRPLYTPEHFARFVGEVARVEVSLPIAGRRRFQGPISGVEGATITLDQDGEAVAIAAGNVHKAKLVPQFDAPTGGRKPGGKAGKVKK